MNGVLDAAEEQRHWEWLDGNLGAYRNKIKAKVTQLYNDPNNKPLQFYTSHELDHCQKVEDLIHRLIPRDRSKRLDQMERFYLLASAWLHDIGMLSTVAERVWKRRLTDNEIRELHHITAERFIRDWPFECGVEEPDRHFLATLCRYHRKREDLRVLKDMAVGTRKFNLPLLAAYLRLADALHVDLTRAPDRQFSHCLAYNIPAETKLHWIKSRVVSGIVLDDDRHLIEVQFQRPSERDIEALGLDFNWVNAKITAVTRYVLEELREELSSVMYILTRGGVSYYLDVQEMTATGVDNVTLNHLLTLVMNYDVLVWPSASRLLEIILVNLAEIIGYHLRHGAPPVVLPMPESGDARERTDRFLRLLSDDCRSPRAFHHAIRSFVDECRALIDKPSFSIEALLDLIDKRYQQQHDYRAAIRRHAAERHDGLRITDEPVTNILLYGYSELVIKALCGLRDQLIRGSGQEPRGLYNSPKELEFSGHFRIFICEGQPKTHTGVQDRLLYHDGVAYALALRRRGFTNLLIVPDAVVSAISVSYPIRFFMIGANGFDSVAFHHSAGHASLIYLLRGMQDEGASLPDPKIVLVVSSDKFRKEPIGGPTQVVPRGNRGPTDVDGYAFWSGGDPVSRSTVWLNRDQRVREELRAEREHIQLFNPREEEIPIALVDSVVCDCGVFPIRDADGTKTLENIRAFLAAAGGCGVPP